MSNSFTTYLGRTRRLGKPAPVESNFIEHVLRAYFTVEERSKLTFIYPYLSRRQILIFSARNFFVRIFKLDRPTVFITHENLAPRWNIAPFQIGFEPDNQSPMYQRFPNWQLRLKWPQLPTQPSYQRFGENLDINVLMRPINATFPKDQRFEKAVIFTSHLREPRGSLYEAVSHVIGCDGFGNAFGEEARRIGGKYETYRKYKFALCPENSVGPGYITEKIPEAFYAGCIPITWCQPQDLRVDFNEKAVVNLYGTSARERTLVLERLREDDGYVSQLRSEPLLLRRPSLDPLVAFLKRVARPPTLHSANE